MGSYTTRSRAWVYIAFYDEYSGKHINTAAGLSLLFFVPCYWYGIHMNRVKELNYNMKYYDWNYTDKRNRLTHNMIMEHFEVHTEQLQDLLVDLNTEGAKVFENLPAEKVEKTEMTIDELALIDEMSGFADYVDGFIKNNKLPVHVVSRLESHVHRYTGKKTKDEIRFELNQKLYGPSR